MLLNTSHHKNTEYSAVLYVTLVCCYRCRQHSKFTSFLWRL